MLLLEGHSTALTILHHSSAFQPHPWPIMAQPEVLVCKRFAIHRLAACAVAVGEVATLQSTVAAGSACMVMLYWQRRQAMRPHRCLA